MKLWLPLLLCAALTAGSIGCKKASNSPIPFISFISLSPDSVRAKALYDTSFLTFHFSDGDGDLGNDITQGDYDVFLRDTRDSAFPLFRYPFPPIPDGAINEIDGISGEGSIALLGSLLPPRQDTLHKFNGDTVIFEMWIMDRAKNMSNVIRIPPLYIKP